MRCSMVDTDAPSLGDQGRETGVGHHVVAGGNGDALVDEGDAEFAPGQEFQGDRLAGVQADAGDPEDAVDGRLAFDHDAAFVSSCFFSPSCSFARASYFRSSSRIWSNRQAMALASGSGILPCSRSGRSSFFSSRAAP